MNTTVVKTFIGRTEQFQILFMRAQGDITTCAVVLSVEHLFR